MCTPHAPEGRPTSPRSGGGYVSQRAGKAMYKEIYVWSNMSEIPIQLKSNAKHALLSRRRTSGSLRGAGTFLTQLKEGTLGLWVLVKEG